MYVKLSPEKKEVLRQGDIVEDFPFFSDSVGNTIDTLEESGVNTYKVNKLLVPFATPQEISGVFRGKTKRVIILSQTCDIQNNDYVQIAPIFSLGEMAKVNLKTIEHIQKSNNRVKDWFYLPASNDKNFNGILIDDFPNEGFVYFQTINSFPKDKLILFSQKRIVALSEWGQSLLSWAIVNYFGRPIENKYRAKETP